MAGNNSNGFGIQEPPVINSSRNHYAPGIHDSAGRSSYEGQGTHERHALTYSLSTSSRPPNDEGLRDSQATSQGYYVAGLNGTYGNYTPSDNTRKNGYTDTRSRERKADPLLRENLDFSRTDDKREGVSPMAYDESLKVSKTSTQIPEVEQLD